MPDAGDLWEISLSAPSTSVATMLLEGLAIATLAAAVWMGNPDYKPMPAGSDGIFVAAPAWHQFMEFALRGVSATQWYSPPSDVVRGNNNTWFLVDPTTGQPINNITHLPGDVAPPQSPGDFGVPPDPGTGPQPIGRGGGFGGGGGGGGAGGGGIVPPVG